MFTCVIVDDEPLSHKVLIRYINNFGGLQLIKQFFSATNARDFLNISKPDILFLDIQMPEITGIQLLDSLTEKPVTIITTAFLDYALEGFELGVIDYLVKPIHYDRFTVAVTRATEFLSLLQIRSNLEEKNDQPQLLNIKTGTKKLAIERAHITHVQALKDYLIIYCGGCKYVIRSTIKRMAEILGTDHFIRSHKSFIVAKNKITHVAGNNIYISEFEIPVGRKYKPEINLLFSK